MLRAILTYHSIDDSGSAVSTSEAAFGRQMASLAKLSICVAAPTALASGQQESDAVALTFDDGFANFYTGAAPSLAEHSMSATVLLVTGFCDGKGRWSGQQAQDMLSWSRINELQQAGIAFGAHSVDHPSLPSLSLDQARAQIIESKQIIENRTGSKVDCFAYPYGEYTEGIAEIVAENFAVGLTTNMGFVTARSRRERLERIDAYYLRSPFWFDRMFRASGRSYLACRALARNAGRRTPGNAG